MRQTTALLGRMPAVLTRNGRLGQEAEGVKPMARGWPLRALARAARSPKG
jgi:hypothetical protein